MPRIRHHMDEATATRAVTMIEGGQSQRSVALQLGCSRRAIQNVWNRYQQTGSVTRRQFSSETKNQIDYQPVVFEPNNNDNPEYRVIYEEFKNLVDLMLGTYMEDIGITPEQFENACSKEHTNELPIHFQKNLFEQIWAANDYNVFIRMMCQKNIELQLQALELIKVKHGITSDLFSTVKIDGQNQNDENLSVRTPTEEQIATNCESYEPVISDMDIEKISTEFENQLQDELKIKKKELDNALETALTQASSSYKAVQGEKVDKLTTVVGNVEELSSVHTLNKSINSNTIDKNELQKRQEYLKLQRDRLVTLKKQLREKQLQASIDDSTNAEKRPKSAKVAAAVLSSSETKPDLQSLQIRRALAEKLRTEVVSNKK